GTREGLVDAAEPLFTTNGFHATSVDAVADAAGYTKGAVYSNFASKEDLFFAVYARRVDRRVEEMEQTLAGFRSDAVADAAGYTKGAVYSNFASKEDLFFAVYARRVDRRVEEMEQTLDGF